MSDFIKQKTKIKAETLKYSIKEIWYLNQKVIKSLGAAFP